ncbi:MAG: hypothetical protein AAB534_02555 [Patescibacteria group bacterium]
MRNTAKKGKIHYLIINRGEKGYLGICKEFGFVEEGKSEKDLVERLFRSSILLLETVQKNPNLEPSLNVRPPFKYLMLFFVAPLLSSIVNLFSRFNGEIKLLTQHIPNNRLSSTHA